MIYVVGLIRTSVPHYKILPTLTVKQFLGCVCVVICVCVYHASLNVLRFSIKGTQRLWTELTRLNRFYCVSTRCVQPGRPVWLTCYCWRVSHSVTHKHELWIWFTLSYAMMKALLRQAAVRDTKQPGELRGDTVHFIASSSALVLMTQNGNICQPLTLTATCLLRLDSNLSFTTIQQ